MDYKTSHQEFEKGLFELIEENKKIPIIVEGDKDVFSLRKLGISGQIITINSGLSIIDFCDKIANKYKEIILLTDWDKKRQHISGYFPLPLHSLLHFRIFTPAVS